jgi:hypothetical protein
MIVPFFIFDAGTGDPLAGVVPTFNTYKKVAADGSVTSLTPPTITDKGGGLYEFATAAGDASNGTTLAYVIDCTTAALSRYLQGNINGDEAVAASQSVSGAAINQFGVDADAVRRHMFPQWSAFSSKSNPTAATVAEMIDEQAATLCGKLKMRSIQFGATDINATDTPLAFSWCAQTLKLMVAIAIVPAATGFDPAVARRWKAELKDRLDGLQERGAEVLGGDAPVDTVGDDAMGVTDHISEYSLAVTDTADMSDAVAPLHRDDQL